jgi:phage shock protein A
MRDKVLRSEALAGARAELAGDSLNDRLLALGKDDEIEVLLQQIKVRKGITG